MGEREREREKERDEGEESEGDKSLTSNLTEFFLHAVINCMMADKNVIKIVLFCSFVFWVNLGGVHPTS